MPPFDHMHERLPSNLTKVLLRVFAGVMPGRTRYQTTSRAADSTTGSRTSLDLLKRWLAECRRNHPQCQLRGKPRLPTRVIDLGSLKEDCQPQLLITDPEQSEDYLALSHCWGKPEHHNETRAWAADPNHLLPLNE